MTRGRCLVLFLAFYAGLDFANPLMPGAVYFADGAVSAVDGRAAPGTSMVVPPPSSSMERPVVMSTPAPELVGVDAPRARPWRTSGHRPGRRVSAPPPLGDDH
ncbi:MAG TPA: hypothetical protein VJU81_18540 [Methylomirabilota bacterium]|nr:hypothetical protein [Methylomirabilota bacterium]